MKANVDLSVREGKESGLDKICERWEEPTPSFRPLS